jgi:hypothetical protein
MFTPIHALETELHFTKESLHTQSYTNLSNLSTITLDNTGNMERDILATITLKNTFFSGFAITNLTNNLSIVIPAPDINYPQYSKFLIYPDAVYLNNTDTEINATFTAPFVVAEHMVNTLQFLLPANIDVEVSWIKPDESKKEIVFVQGFSVTQNNSIQRQKNNLLNKYAKGYITSEISYDFNIDRLWIDSDFFNDYNNESRYQIIYQTDNSVNDIMPQTFYLSNCCFSGNGFSQGESDMVKENIRGSCCRVLNG